MSDLSRLLDDLYAMSGTETDTDDEIASGTATEEPTRAPEWSSEEALDEVFASWVPGADDDASTAERSMLAGTHSEPQDPRQPIDDAWLHATEPLAVVAPVPAPRWSPSDDDILPGRRLAVATRSRRRRR